eukprot:TRINITY_DN71395_c0_g1_i1.p1 TRINITY_DN71395_c0_g1~~TRINITY_DN71395_c0_g1_i1.p1  ORF type:complete len:618 (+),score=93.08 TRINITY_DN71395_c0_g1_i1:100-1953(+)
MVETKVETPKSPCAFKPPPPPDAGLHHLSQGHGFAGESTTTYEGKDDTETKSSDSSAVNVRDAVRRTTFDSQGSSCSSGRKAMFINPDDMKQKVRRTLTKPEYNVADFYWPTGVWRSIATNPLFEHTTLCVISVNAIWISIDTDNNAAEVLLDAEPVFFYAENFFCVYFFFEWFVRFMAFKRKRNGLRDAWFVFDSALVFMMVFETWIMTFFMLISGTGGGGALGNAAILRLLRLLRLSRLARMLRSMPELMILIKGMISAGRSLVFTMCLLLILIYIFAIMMRQITDGSGVGELYFNSIPESMYSLLLYGTFMDNFGPVCIQMGFGDTGHWIYLILFFLFVAMAALMVMNMLIGVLCEVVSAVASTEKEEMLVSWVKGKMEKIISALDNDGDLQISKDEFSKILENKEACETLFEMDVDPVSLVDFADFIFDDGDSNDIDLSFSDFMEVVMSFRGSQGATVKDMFNLMKITRGEMKKLEDRVKGTRPLRKGSVASLSRISTAAMSSPVLCEAPAMQDDASTCVPRARSWNTFTSYDEGLTSKNLSEAGPRTEGAEALLVAVHSEVCKLGKEVPSHEFAIWAAKFSNELTDGLTWLNNYNCGELVRPLSFPRSPCIH